MAKLSIVAGTTSKTVDVLAQNNTSTKGAGLTGLVYNSTNLQAYYYREGANATVAIALATATLGTWATGGFIVIDGPNMPGMYQLSIPNLALAAGAKSVKIYIFEITTTALNLAPIILEIELTATDNQDGVHGGMSALPNTACTTNASLLTSGTSTDQIKVDNAGNAYVNVNLWNLHTVSLDSNNYPQVGVSSWANTGVAVDGAGVPLVGLYSWAGTLVSNTQGKPAVQTVGWGTSASALNSDAGGNPSVNTVDWNGTAVATPNMVGVPIMDLKYVLGTLTTAATAGLLDVNTKKYNNLTAQTDANSLPKVDVEFWRATQPNVLISGRVDANAGVVGDKGGYSLVATGLNLVLVDGKTLPVALQYIAASTAGIVSGAGTGTETFLGIDGVTVRLVISADASGNRTAVVYS